MKCPQVFKSLQYSPEPDSGPSYEPSLGSQDLTTTGPARPNKNKNKNKNKKFNKEKYFVPFVKAGEDESIFDDPFSMAEVDMSSTPEFGVAASAAPKRGMLKEELKIAKRTKHSSEKYTDLDMTTAETQKNTQQEKSDIETTDNKSQLQAGEHQQPRKGMSDIEVAETALQLQTGNSQTRGGKRRKAREDDFSSVLDDLLDGQESLLKPASEPDDHKVMWKGRRVGEQATKDNVGVEPKRHPWSTSLHTDWSGHSQVCL